MFEFTFQMTKPATASMNSYQLAADLVVVVHATYVTFVVAAVVLVLLGYFWNWQWVRNFWFRLIHFCMIAVVVVQSLVGVTCPLTTLENNLRLRGGESIEQASFIGYWVHELLFVDAPTWVLTVSYCLFGILVVSTFYLVPPHWTRCPGSTSE